MSELFNRVNWIDIFALILLFRISYISSRIGVGKQILPAALLLLILLISLYYYKPMAEMIGNTLSIQPSILEFLCFFCIVVPSIVTYSIVQRLTVGFLSTPGIEGGSIEKTGGAVLGIFRSLVMIGIIFIGLALFPVHFVRDSVRRSYSGPIIVNLNLRMYSQLATIIFRKSEISYTDLSRDILWKKREYLFKPIDLKAQTEFFRKRFQSGGKNEIR